MFKTCTGKRKKLVTHCIGIILFILSIPLISHNLCSIGAESWFKGDLKEQKKLSFGVGEWINSEIEKEHFSTGSKKFNGEWLFGTYMMAGMGFGQTALEHPELRDEHIKFMNKCIDKILSEEVKSFDSEAWGEDPLETLDKDSDHAAYLGYFNLLLSLHRMIEPASQYAKLNDRITETLVRRLEKSPLLLLHTYPHEVYPVDNCSVIGSIGLYDRATGANHRELIEKWVKNCRGKYIDPHSGLLYQSVRPDNGEPFDAPRGSGTALGLYFLSFADMELSGDLYKAVKTELEGNVLGFGAVKEYPSQIISGGRDIDSGPIIFGYGFSATGFTIGGSRIHGDGEYFTSLYSTSYLVGCPLDSDNRRIYVMGGPLGNAIMFAMLTAHKVGKGNL